MKAVSLMSSARAIFAVATSYFLEHSMMQILVFRRKGEIYQMKSIRQQKNLRKR
jgi:hypothetical protein